MADLFNRLSGIFKPKKTTQNNTSTQDTQRTSPFQSAAENVGSTMQAGLQRLGSALQSGADRVGSALQSGVDRVDSVNLGETARNVSQRVENAFTRAAERREVETNGWRTSPAAQASAEFIAPTDRRSLSYSAYTRGQQNGEDWANASDDDRRYVNTYYQTLDDPTHTQLYRDLQRSMQRSSGVSQEEFNTQYRAGWDQLQQELSELKSQYGSQSYEYKALARFMQDYEELGRQATSQYTTRNAVAQSQALDSVIRDVYSGVVNSEDFHTIAEQGREEISRHPLLSAQYQMQWDNFNATPLQRELMYYTYATQGKDGVTDLYRHFMGDVVNNRAAASHLNQTINGEHTLLGRVIEAVSGQDIPTFNEFIDRVTDGIDNEDFTANAIKKLRRGIQLGLEDFYGAVVDTFNAHAQTFTNTEMDPEDDILTGGYSIENSVDDYLRRNIGNALTNEDLEVGEYIFNSLGDYGYNEEWYLDALTNASDYQKQLLGVIAYQSPEDAAAAWDEIKGREAEIWQTVKGSGTLATSKLTFAHQLRRAYEGMGGRSAPGIMGAPDGTTFAQAIDDTLNTMGDQYPATVVNYALSAMGAPGVARYVSSAIMASQIYGRSYKEVRDEGHTKNQSSGYAAAQAASEFIFDLFFDGVGKAAGLGTEGLSGAITRNMASPFFRALTELGIRTFSEGAEEYAQDLLEPMWRNMFFGEDNPFKLMTEESKYSFFQGAMAALLMGGSSVGTDIAVNISNKKLGDGLIAQNSTPKLLDYVINNPIEEGTRQQIKAYKKVAELAERMRDGKTPTNGINVGEVMSDYLAAGGQLEWLANPATVEYNKDTLSQADLIAGVKSYLVDQDADVNLADAIVRTYLNENVSEEVTKIISENPVAQQVLEQLRGDIDLNENNALTRALRASTLPTTDVETKTYETLKAENPDLNVLTPVSATLVNDGVKLETAERVGGIIEKALNGEQITLDEAKQVKAGSVAIRSALLRHAGIDLDEYAKAEDVMAALNQKAAEVAKVKDMQQGVKEAAKPAAKARSPFIPAQPQAAQGGVANGQNTVQGQSAAGAAAEAGSGLGEGSLAGNLQNARSSGNKPAQRQVGEGSGHQRGQERPGHRVIPPEEYTPEMQQLHKLLTDRGAQYVEYVEGEDSGQGLNEHGYYVRICTDGKFTPVQYADHESIHLWMKALSRAQQAKITKNFLHDFFDRFGRAGLTTYNTVYKAYSNDPTYQKRSNESDEEYKDRIGRLIIEELFAMSYAGQKYDFFDFSQAQDIAKALAEENALEEIGSGQLDNAKVQEALNSGWIDKDYYARQAFDKKQEMYLETQRKQKAEESKPKRTYTEARKKDLAGFYKALAEKFGKDEVKAAYKAARTALLRSKAAEDVSPENEQELVIETMLGYMQKGKALKTFDFSKYKDFADSYQMGEETEAPAETEGKSVITEKANTITAEQANTFERIRALEGQIEGLRKERRRLARQQKDKDNAEYLNKRKSFDEGIQRRQAAVDKLYNTLPEAYRDERKSVDDIDPEEAQQIGLIGRNGMTAAFTDNVNGVHEEILSQMTGQDWADSDEFIRSGGIRVKPGVGIELNADIAPTIDQYLVLDRIVDTFKGKSFSIDFNILGTNAGSHTFTGADIDANKVYTYLRNFYARREADKARNATLNRFSDILGLPVQTFDEAYRLAKDLIRMEGPDPEYQEIIDTYEDRRFSKDELNELAPRGIIRANTKEEYDNESSLQRLSEQTREFKSRGAEARSAQDRAGSQEEAQRGVQPVSGRRWTLALRPEEINERGILRTARELIDSGCRLVPPTTPAQRRMAEIGRQQGVLVIFYDSSKGDFTDLGKASINGRAVFINQDQTFDEYLKTYRHELGHVLEDKHRSENDLFDENADFRDSQDVLREGFDRLQVDRGVYDAVKNYFDEVYREEKAENLFGGPYNALDEWAKNEVDNAVQEEILNDILAENRDLFTHLGLTADEFDRLWQYCVNAGEQYGLFPANLYKELNEIAQESYENDERKALDNLDNYFDPASADYLGAEFDESFLNNAAMSDAYTSQGQWIQEEGNTSGDRMDAIEANIDALLAAYSVATDEAERERLVEEIAKLQNQTKLEAVEEDTAHVQAVTPASIMSKLEAKSDITQADVDKALEFGKKHLTPKPFEELKEKLKQYGEVNDSAKVEKKKPGRKSKTETEKPKAPKTPVEMAFRPKQDTKKAEQVKETSAGKPKIEAPAEEINSEDERAKEIADLRTILDNDPGAATDPEFLARLNILLSEIREESEAVQGQLRKATEESEDTGADKALVPATLASVFRPAEAVETEVVQPEAKKPAAPKDAIEGVFAPAEDTAESPDEARIVLRDDKTKYTKKPKKYWETLGKLDTFEIRRLDSGRDSFDVRFKDSKGNTVVFADVSPSGLVKSFAAKTNDRESAKVKAANVIATIFSPSLEWTTVRNPKIESPEKVKAEHIRGKDNYGRKVPENMTKWMENSVIRDENGSMLNTYRVVPGSAVHNAKMPEGGVAYFVTKPAVANTKRGLTGEEAYGQRGKRIGDKIAKLLKRIEKAAKSNNTAALQKARDDLAKLERENREYTDNVTRLDPWRGMQSAKIEDIVNGYSLLETYLDIRKPLVIDAKGKGIDFVQEEVLKYYSNPKNKAGQFDSSNNPLGQYDGFEFCNVNVMEDGATLGGGKLDLDTVYVTMRPNQAKSTWNTDPTDSPYMQFSKDIDGGKFSTGFTDGGMEDVILRIQQADSPEHAAAILDRYARNLIAAQQTEQTRMEKEKAMFQPNVSEATAEELRKELAANVKKYGALEKGENPVRDVTIPKATDSGNVRRVFRTAEESKHTPERVVPMIDREILTGDTTYQRITDKTAIAFADREMARKGYDKVKAEWEARIDSNEKITKNDVAVGELLYIEALKGGDYETAMQMLAELGEVGTTAGQVVQAFRMLKNMPKTYQLYYLQRMVKRLNRQYSKMIESGKIDRIKIDTKLARAVLEAQTNEEIEAAIDAVMQNIADQVPVTWMDKWNAWRYLSMLGNPKTHIRNLFGNGIFAPAKFARNLISAGLQGVIIKDPAQRNKSIKGLVGRNPEYRKIAEEDYKGIKQQLQSGGKYNISNEILEKRTIFKSRILEFFRKTNDYFLNEIEDGLFLKAHYVNALTTYLATSGMDAHTLQATPEGSKVMNAARQYAFNEALKATYRDASTAATALNGLKKIPGLGVLVEGAIPFTKTPINILKRGIEYSPIGLLNAVSRNAYRLKKGEITASEFCDDLGAGLTGTAIAFLGFWLASQGILRGGDDDNEKQADFDTLQGYQNYSITIGDRNYTIDWAAPSALPLFVGSALFKEMRDKDGLDEADFYNAALVIAEPITQLSMLSGVNDILKSSKYDKNPLSSVVETMISGYASQGIPTLLAQIARSTVADRRTTFVDKNSDVPPTIQRWWQTNVMGKVPVLNGERTEYIDAWGRTDTTQNFLVRLYENMFAPWYRNEINTTPVDAELQRLANATGTGVLMSTAKRTIEFNNETHNLTADQYKLYAQTRGTETYNMLSALFNSFSYQHEMSEEERAKAVNLLMEYGNILGKQAVFPEYETDNDNWAQKCDGDINRLLVMAQLKAQASVRGIDASNNGNFYSLIIESNWLTDIEQGYAMAQQYTTTTKTISVGRGHPSYELNAERKQVLYQSFRNVFPAYYAELIQTDAWKRANLEEKLDMLAKLRKQVGTMCMGLLAQQLEDSGAVS